MSRRAEGQLFVGRLAKETRTRDLEDVFEMYGRLSRCEIKYGAEMAYAFVDFEDRRDAEDAQKYENGRDIRGCSIIVEWAKGAPRRPLVGDRNAGYDECYKCHRVGHWARDCPDDRHYGYRRRGRSRSRSRRRRRSRSRSRSKDRRRSRRSLSHSRSKSNDRKRSRRSPRSRSKSRQKSGSKSPRPERKSPSKSPRRSPSHSPKKIGDQQKSDTEYKSSDE